MATITCGVYRYVTPHMGPDRASAGGPASSPNPVGDLNPHALQGWMDQMTAEDLALGTLRVRADSAEGAEGGGELLRSASPGGCSASEEHARVKHQPKQSGGHNGIWSSDVFP